MRIGSYVISGGSLTDQYLLFYFGIIFADWVGGFGSGLLATILAALSPAVLCLSPLDGFRIRRIDEPSDLMVFLAMGFAISFLNEARFRAKLRPHAAEEEIRHRKMRSLPGRPLDQLAASNTRRMQT